MVCGRRFGGLAQLADGPVVHDRAISTPLSGSQSNSLCKPYITVLDPFCGCATALVAAERLGRLWVGIDISPKAAELVNRRIHDDLGFLTWRATHRDDLPQRTDLGVLPAPRTHKRALYGQQAGHCAGCDTHFEIQHFHVDHIIAVAKGGTDHPENLQLLCGHCNSVKGDRGMEYLRAKLQLAA